MGLTSQKNFITANAVENILAVPKKVPAEPVRYRAKPDYGKTPKYLERVKQEIDEEYKYVQQLQQQVADANRENVRLLTEPEREELLRGLRAKWDEVQKNYQTLKFASDTPGHFQRYVVLSLSLSLYLHCGCELKKNGIPICRKELFEQQMRQIEKDIEKLSKKMVYVHEDF